MNNDELFDAIAFTWQAAENANKGYCIANNDRARLMYDYLKALLSIQLDRAKKGYHITTVVNNPKLVKDLICQETMKHSRAGDLVG